MVNTEKMRGAFPYRVLDLSDEKGFLCGAILASLGADVIKIESPGGDPSRNIGPFYHDIPDPERSLYWFAYNRGKRGITLDIQTADGQRIFKMLVKTADFVIESFPPSYMDDLGIGYKVLRDLNPRIIMTSISAFGQTGPYSQYKATDIVATAMGGLMYITGDADRPPVRCSIKLSYMHAGAHAAVGSLLALHYRERGGMGQHVDVSMQEAVVRQVYIETALWEYTHSLYRRCGSRARRGTVVQRETWECKDGRVSFKILGGAYGRGIRPLVEWMESEGMAGSLGNIDWSQVDIATLTQEESNIWEDAFAKFFRQHTVEEIYQQALERRIYLLPVYTPKQICEDSQLKARNFWTRIHHEELGETLVYPGPPVRFSQTPMYVRQRAPLVGEHNQEVYKREMGLSKEELVILKKSGVTRQISTSIIEKPRKALEGIKVADFSTSAAAPLITKALGDYGAKVIKIESKIRLDIMRVSAPYKDGVPGIERSGLFISVNTSKYSTGLRLEHPRGREVAKKIVAWSDVVVENFTPGTIDKLGLGYEELKNVKPDIIMLSHSLQGQTGPHSRHPGFGFNMKGLAGFTELTGWPDREPAGLPPPYTDVIAPWWGLVAILAALDYRRRTGVGQYIDMNQFESSVHFLSPALLDYTVNERVQSRTGNKSTCYAPHGAYRCKGNDKWCVIAVKGDDEWQKFCSILGEPKWTRDPKFATHLARVKHVEELDALISKWTANHSAKEVMTAMQSLGIAAGIVETPEDIFEDPQLKHREYFQRARHPEIGDCYLPDWPFKLSETPSELRTPPLFGQDTEYVCTKILNMPDKEFIELLAQGVLE